MLFPIFNDYPESKFGGFLARTDYRDTFIADEIKAHGWMIWPPIHYSYHTIKRALPTPAPSPPTWMLTEAQCTAAAARVLPPGKPNSGCADIEWNWLGTDDQGRDVAARLIYGFQDFGAFRPRAGIDLLGRRRRGGRGAGLFRRLDRSHHAAADRDLVVVPQLYLLIILSSIITPSFFVLLGTLLLFSWVSLVHVVRAEFLRARNFEYVTAARALGLSNARIMVKHVLPNAMVATLTFLPFVLNGSISTLTALDFLGFGLPSGSASLGELLLKASPTSRRPGSASRASSSSRSCSRC